MNYATDVHNFTSVISYDQNTATDMQNITSVM